VTVRPGLSLILAVALLCAGCAAPAPTSGARDLPPVTLIAAEDEQVTVNVVELFCRSCEEHILAGCKQIPGIGDIEVDRQQQLLTLHFDPTLTTRERVLAALDDIVATVP
jgi:copper chaperone CopZ